MSSNSSCVAEITQALCLVVLLSLPVVSNVYAQPVSEEEEQLIGLYGDENIISIATGIQQSLTKAPAVASVVTAREIEAMGARDLDEILESVPGLHVSRSYISYSPLYIFRGIHSTYNPQVLVMINGIPITNLFHGDRNLIWGGMPVESIARIEVIRGPGSAVYGAEAFAGTINIVTKTADDINGLELSANAGSFNSRGLSALYGHKAESFDLAITAEYNVTDGSDAIIESDAQTVLDMLTGTDASLAPGSVNLSHENLDLRFDISNEHWRFRSGLQQRGDVGSGAGVAEALDPHNRYRSERISSDLTWDNQYANGIWDLSAQLSYLKATQEIEKDLIIYPPGVNLGFGVLDDGLIGNPEVFETHTRFNFTATFSAFSDHSLRIGAGYYFGDLYKVRETKNFGIDPDTGFPLPANSPMVDVTDTPYVFLREGNRENTFVFIQDIWQLAADWELTAGLRYDDYSDFGDTTNPRFALVWSTTRKLTTKLLYGEAFRAPSFAETRAINNPVVLGNPFLDPERLKSLELDFNYQYSDELLFSFNRFRYQWEDIIRFVPDEGATSSTARNSGERQGYGWEAEMDWQALQSLEIIANYAWVNTEDEGDGERSVAFAPHRQAYIGADWRIQEQASVFIQLHHIMDRERELADTRPPVDDYSIVNVAFNYQFSPRTDLQLLVSNVFAEDAREPSIWSTQANIPNDLPLEDRTYRLTFSFAL